MIREKGFFSFSFPMLINNVVMLRKVAKEVINAVGVLFQLEM